MQQVLLHLDQGLLSIKKKKKKNLSIIKCNMKVHFKTTVQYFFISFDKFGDTACPSQN